jgi:hypothetical protein
MARFTGRMTLERGTPPEKSRARHTVRLRRAPVTHSGGGSGRVAPRATVGAGSRGRRWRVDREIGYPAP